MTVEHSPAKALRRLPALYVGLGLASATLLLFELTLMRLFAVAEWYHFAFLSVGVALLGNTVGGVTVALVGASRARQMANGAAMAFPWSLALAYWALNRIPFDSYRLAWEPRQLAYLVLYDVGLAIPFAVGGYLVAYCLAMEKERAHRLYAANLVGSALGALALLGLLPTLGGEGTVWAAVGLGALGAGGLAYAQRFDAPLRRKAVGKLALPLNGLALACALAGLIGRPAWWALRLSPYKALRYALQAPGARLEWSRWHASARIDVVSGEQIHSAPGLSLRYEGRLPPQDGLTLDGDDLVAITRRTAAEDRAFLRYLPLSVATALRPGGTALIIYPRGGMDVAVALEYGLKRVAVVEDNPLLFHVVRDLYGEFTGGLYRDPRLELVLSDGRSALQSTKEQYDLIVLSLAESYHPLTAGTYGLREDYRYTVEGISAALERLTPQGILVITRWAQDPPAESLRAAAIIVEALERAGKDPRKHLLAYRSWATVTLLASPDPWSPEEISAVRQHCERLGFDMAYYEGMPPEEANRFNRLQGPGDYEALTALLEAPDRRTFYRTQFYDVSPPTDDRPFFGHYFRWRQLPVIVRQWGKTWQPFGGSGFLIVLGYLVLAILFSGALALLPFLAQRRAKRPWAVRLDRTVYFAAIGLGFMLIEIPLMQRFILYIGQPTVAFTFVLTGLLLFCGLGSALADRMPLRWILFLLVGLALAYPALLRFVTEHTLGLARPVRWAIGLGLLLPLGWAMGVPFAGAFYALREISPSERAWVWAVNGSASVVGSTLAAVIALSAGYRAVLGIAAGCYGLAAILSRAFSSRRKVLGAPQEGHKQDVADAL